MTLESFPNGCLFIASIFAILGLVLDSVVIQFGSGKYQDETIEYFVIWKSSTVRKVSTITSSGKSDRYSLISEAKTISQDSYITNYDYIEADHIFCGSNHSLNVNTTNSSNQNTSNRSSQNTSCSAFSPIAHWLNASRIMYIITISFVVSTMAIWTILKCPIKLINKRLNIKLLLLILKILCFISWTLSVLTLLVLLIGSLLIHESNLVDSVMIPDFKLKNVGFGPTVWMLIVNMAVTAVTIYSAFYSRTPSIVFVEWARPLNESSDDSDSS